MKHFGPQVEEGGVRFRLWAPDAGAIFLQFRDGPEIALRDAKGGWREAFAPVQAGTNYRFRMGETLFPDPASQAQDGGVHGWSVVVPVHESADSWKGRPWEETVLYECHPGLMGGFKGLAARLESLAQLGITAVELMPIAVFPGAHNWGYDGVLPYAPAEAYGTPDDLRALIGQAHGLEMMIFLDVVYNHFGPEGNYLPLYAKRFFRDDISTPWGAAIDFRLPEVREFFAQNARQWLFDYGFDGLRFDAIHAINDAGWLADLAKGLKSEAGDRQIHLVLENEDNGAALLRSGFDAQWNDDIHHAFHVLLTGESGGYYRDFADAPAAHLARALAEGFVYQGQLSASRNGRPRGEPSADLPPSSFVSFLQNHDQIGNRALGDRLTRLAAVPALRAAMTLLLLSPQIPMLFMGEECGSRSPFLYFTDHGPELAQLVREGRAREFAAFAGQAGGVIIPDPNDAATFAASRPGIDAPDSDSWRALVRDLLAVRRRHIMPFIRGAKSTGAAAIGEKAVRADWILRGGSRLRLIANLGNSPVAARTPEAGAIWGQGASGEIAPMTTRAWISP